MVASARTPELPTAKRRQILAGARRAFGELGYERASVDLVAAHAGVSKATVYNHFGDKKSLYAACFAEEADAMREELLASLGAPEGEVEEALRSMGRKLTAVTLSAPILTLYRHTMGESARFPELGQALWERGPQVVYAMIARWLGRWDEKGALRIEDARAAAVQFVMLCQGDLFLRAQLGAVDPASPLVQETVESGVRTFLRAYRGGAGRQ